MSESIENLLYGAVAGLFTALFIWIGKLVFNHFLPHLKKMLYRGFIIDGEWHEEHNLKNSGLIQKSTIKIEQKAYKIKGIIIVEKFIANNEKFDKPKIFKLEGKIYNKFININCYNNDSKLIGIHNYLLETHFDGRILSGYKTFYEISKKEILSEKIVWNRIDNEDDKSKI
jgi:hypothetical protein